MELSASMYKAVQAAILLSRSPFRDWYWYMVRPKASKLHPWTHLYMCIQCTNSIGFNGEGADHHSTVIKTRVYHLKKCCACTCYTMLAWPLGSPYNTDSSPPDNALAAFIEVRAYTDTAISGGHERGCSLDEFTGRTASLEWTGCRRKRLGVAPSTISRATSFPPFVII